MEENKNVQQDVGQNPENSQNVNGFDKFFGVSAKGSTIGREIIAGIVTFLAMCYILTLNPSIICGTWAPNLWSSVFIATAFGAVIGTLLMAFLAKMPLAQASGLGLNSMVALALQGFLVPGMQFTFGNVMLLVFISGLIFIVLTLCPYKRDKETGRLIAIREAVFNGMPKQLKAAISVGIGLFITLIGLVNSGIVGSLDGVNFFTAIDLLPFNKAALWDQGQAACSSVVFLFGLFVIGILSHFKVKGSVIIGIGAATLLAWPLGVTSVDIITGNGGISWKFWENFSNFFAMNQADGGSFFVVFTEGFQNLKSDAIIGSIIVIITFCMIDMFDTMGTVVGCCSSAGLVDENGKPLNYNKIMLSDSIATCAGAILGTSTVTTFVESGSGIAAGGRTGLTALTTAVCFFLAIFVMPLFAFIPSAACSSALVYVGVLMMSGVKNVDFKDIKTAIPAFLTIIFMPFGYSITDGIGVGVISYVIINFIVWLVEFILFKSGKKEEKPTLDISPVLLVIFCLFLVYFLVPYSI